MAKKRLGRHGGVSIEISPGELIDKISILEIKEERISEPDKLRNVRHQLRMLQEARERNLDSSVALTELEARLKAVNDILWEVEDALRACEAVQDFGPGFVDLARSVYKTNDQRAALKKQIDTLFGAAITDEKQHPTY